MFYLSEQFSMARNLEMINAQVNAANAVSSNQLNADSLFDAFKSFKGEHKTREELWKDRVKVLAQDGNANDVNSDNPIEFINVRDCSKLFGDRRIIYVDFTLKYPCVFALSSEFKHYSTEVLSFNYDNLRVCLKGFGYKVPSCQEVDIIDFSSKLKEIMKGKLIDFVQVFIKPNEEWICPLNDSVVKAKDEPRIINYLVGISDCK